MYLEKNIKKIRRLKNMTQSDVSKRLSISAQAYSKIESGETRLDTDRLSQIANILGVTVQDIYEFNQDLLNIQANQPKINLIASSVEAQNDIVLSLEKTIEEQKAEIVFLRNQIIFLNSLLGKQISN